MFSGGLDSYRPGDVLIFLSGYLYHTVQRWKPTATPKGSELSPGRIGNVFFSPKASYEKLQDKVSGWNIDTFSSQFPSATGKHPRGNES